MLLLKRQQVRLDRDVIFLAEAGEEGIPGRVPGEPWVDDRQAALVRLAALDRDRIPQHVREVHRLTMIRERALVG